MTTAYNFPDLDISPIDQDGSNASVVTISDSDHLTIVSFLNFFSK